MRLLILRLKIKQSKLFDYGESYLVDFKKHEPLNLTFTYITQQDFIDHHFDDSESEGIANFLNNLGDTKIALILKETAEKTIKGSFRTIHDDVDVSIWAKKMGGGGHKKAAGFTTIGTIDEVLNRIISLT